MGGSTKLAVLAVEDSEDDALLLAHEIGRCCLDAKLTRVDTQEALLHALGEGGWDIVLCDYAMPHFSGMEALQIIRERFPDLPVIIVSGMIGEDLAVEAMRAGANDYMMKGNLKRLAPAVERELRDTVVRAARRRAEEALRESEKRYRQLLDSVTDYIYSVKVRDGRAVATVHGPGCAAVTGYSPEDYKADPDLWYRMVHESDRAAVTEQAAEILAGKSASALEHRIVHRGGSIRWVRNTPVPRYDGERGLTGYDGLIADITERKAVEEGLRQAQKMESIGRLATGVAHDFNNLLTAIVGNAGLLLADTCLGGAVREGVEDILKSANRAAALTGQLLAFGRKKYIQPVVTDPCGLVGELEKMLRRVIGEDIELEIVCRPETGHIVVDSGQMGQVLMNLVVNARDAMPKGGRLTIATGNASAGDPALAEDPGCVPGKYVLIEVSDTGQGMDEGVKAHLFEPFFTTKEKGKGTGLGLSMAYGIVRQNGGFIRVDSELGRGSTFRIYLPGTDDPAMEGKRERESGRSLEGKETVLLVEDDEALRKLTGKILRRYGYSVIEAKDGKEALEAAENRPETVDLLITDMVMPGMCGLEVGKSIRAIRPGIKVLYVSGYADPLADSEGFSAQDISFLQKPFSPTSLVGNVRELLDHR